MSLYWTVCFGYLPEYSKAALQNKSLYLVNIKLLSLLSLANCEKFCVFYLDRIGALKSFIIIGCKQLIGLIFLICWGALSFLPFKTGVLGLWHTWV